MPNIAITPKMSNKGNASFTNPTINIPIKITGKNTNIKTNFEIPHAARNPKKNNFPKIPNKKIKNNIVNIFVFLLSSSSTLCLRLSIADSL